MVNFSLVKLGLSGGGSRAAAASKMERFVIIANGALCNYG